MFWCHFKFNFVLCLHLYSAGIKVIILILFEPCSVVSFGPCRGPWSHTETTARIIGIITAVGTVRRPRRFLSWCVCWTCRGCVASSAACLWLTSDHKGHWQNQWLGRRRDDDRWCRLWAVKWITTYTSLFKGLNQLNMSLQICTCLFLMLTFEEI